MDTRSLCQLCLLMVTVFCGVTEAAWSPTGSSEFAVVGESFTLTCDPQDSNAIAILWKRLDIDTTSTRTIRASVEANGCKISSGSDTQYQYTCEPGPLYKLTIPANVMTNSQNNKVWRCEFPFGIGTADYTVTVAESAGIKNDEQVNNTYEDLNNREVIPEVSTYQAIGITGRKSDSGKLREGTINEDMSQPYQETAEYEAINSDHKKQNESSGVNTYETLGSKTAADTQNTYQLLEKTESHGSEGIPMEMYENTKITS